MRTVWLTLLFASCGSLDLGEGTGEGLVAWDREAPAGAAVFERPEWLPGDRFVYRRGGQLTVALRVAEVADQGYTVVEEKTGMVLELTKDLGEKARRFPDRPSILKVFDPADHELSWPLWVGKKWTCHYLEKEAGKDPQPVRVHSRCEAEEVVRTNAGAEFRCLRIVRTARLELTGRQFLDRTTLLYYSPEVGWFVRRVQDGVLAELESHHRQASRSL